MSHDPIREAARRVAMESMASRRPVSSNPVTHERIAKELDREIARRRRSTAFKMAVGSTIWVVLLSILPAIAFLAGYPKLGLLVTFVELALFLGACYRIGGRTNG